MKLLLKSFSQDVDLDNPEEINYYLVFDAGGKEVKLPVQKNTTEALINLLYSAGENDAELASSEDSENMAMEPSEDLGRYSYSPRNRATSDSAFNSEGINGLGGETDTEISAQAEEESPESEEDVDSL